MVRTFDPALLLSMPQLIDPNFSRTVVLLCRHSHEGALGLIVNRRLVAADCDLDVFVGGPVEPERSWILVGGDEYDDVPVMRIGTGLSLSTSPDLLRRLLSFASLRNRDIHIRRIEETARRMGRLGELEYEGEIYLQGG